MIEEPKHICERCGREFMNSQGLGGHRKTFHSIGLDELNGALEGKTSPDEGSAKLKGYRDSLEKIRKKVESSEEYETYKELMWIVIIFTIIIIFLPKPGNGQEPNTYFPGH
jgi:hypothetical protein